MVEAVVPAAEGAEVVGIGAAAVFPVGDVVDVEVGGAGAAGHGAATVALFDEAAESPGDGAGLATDADGGAVGFEHGAQLGVAQEETS